MFPSHAHGVAERRDRILSPRVELEDLHVKYGNGISCSVSSRLYHDATSKLYELERSLSYHPSPESLVDPQAVRTLR